MNDLRGNMSRKYVILSDLRLNMSNQMSYGLFLPSEREKAPETWGFFNA